MSKAAEFLSSLPGKIPFRQGNVCAILTSLHSEVTLLFYIQYQPEKKDGENTCKHSHKLTEYKPYPHPKNFILSPNFLVGLTIIR